MENYRERGQKSWNRTNDMTYDPTWEKQAMILQQLLVYTKLNQGTNL